MPLYTVPTPGARRAQPAHRCKCRQSCPIRSSAPAGTCPASGAAGRSRVGQGSRREPIREPSGGGGARFPAAGRAGLRPLVAARRVDPARERCGAVGAAWSPRQPAKRARLRQAGALAALHPAHRDADVHDGSLRRPPGAAGASWRCWAALADCWASRGSTGSSQGAADAAETTAAVLRGLRRAPGATRCAAARSAGLCCQRPFQAMMRAPRTPGTAQTPAFGRAPPARQRERS